MGIAGIEELYPEPREEEVRMAEQPENYDEEDVKAALEKSDTADGPGFGNGEDEGFLPDSDFESFAEDDVENEHDGDNEPSEEAAE